MTKKAIMGIINKVNENRTIKWIVSKNTDSEIILKNSYDECVEYRISFKSQDNDEWISIRDNHLDRLVDCLLQGDPECSDYTYTEHGIEMAISAAVHHFNYTY